MKIPSLKSNRGVTLIELMIAVMILSVVVLGGGMFFYHGRVNIIREGHRRAAIFAAGQRLEELKAAPWQEISPVDHNPYFDPGADNPYWITHGNNWKLQQSLSQDPGDSNFSYDLVAVDELVDQRMLTEARYRDEDADGTYDHLEVNVTLEWIDNLTSSVNLTTVITPQ